MLLFIIKTIFNYHLIISSYRQQIKVTDYASMKKGSQTKFPPTDRVFSSSSITAPMDHDFQYPINQNDYVDVHFAPPLKSKGMLIYIVVYDMLTFIKNIGSAKTTSKRSQKGRSSRR